MIVYAITAGRHHRGPGSCLHGIAAPRTGREVLVAGQRAAGMWLATLEALIAGVKVSCGVVERDRHSRLVAKIDSADGVDGRSRIGIGGLCRIDYVAAEDEGR